MKKFTKILIAAGIIGTVKYIYDNVEIKICKKIEKEDERLQNINLECDHIYYDNPYNINKIHLDKDGCPMIFEFENSKDCKLAIEDMCNEFDCAYLDDDFTQFTLERIFKNLGLIVDDYEEYKNYFVEWANQGRKFEEYQEENALENTVNFGKFQKG